MRGNFKMNIKFYIQKINVLTYFCRHGKTTLLRHIASRAFPIPPNIDILYCEQEVVADDLTAVESVLKADVKRTKLLAECKQLEDNQEKGDVSQQKRLSEVNILFNLFLTYGNKILIKFI